MHPPDESTIRAPTPTVVSNTEMSLNAAESEEAREGSKREAGGS